MEGRPRPDVERHVEFLLAYQLLHSLDEHLELEVVRSLFLRRLELNVDSSLLVGWDLTIRGGEGEKLGLSRIVRLLIQQALILGPC